MFIELNLFFSFDYQFQVKLTSTSPQNQQSGDEDNDDIDAALCDLQVCLIRLLYILLTLNIIIYKNVEGLGWGKGPKFTRHQLLVSYRQRSVGIAVVCLH